MKYLFLSVVLLCSFSQTFAQQEEDKLQYLKKAEKYRRMKNTGSTLIVTGSLATVTGLIMLMNSSTTTTSTGYGNVTTETTGNPVGGALLYILGNAALGAGIPIAIVGKNNEKKYNRMLQNLSVSVGGSGAGFVYRF